MSDSRHLTMEQRICLQGMLTDRKPLKEIAEVLGKSPSTISREIRKRSVTKCVGAMGSNFNACALRFECSRARVCSPCRSLKKYSLCRRCTMCNSLCPDFQEEKCPSLSKAPYVCNGCARRVKCTLKKQIYDAGEADRKYRVILSQSREGISLSKEELFYLDGIISPLIRQNQSPYHICTTNRDNITISQSTVYRLIDAKLLSVSNIDLPRKVRFSARKNTVHAKVDKKCRIGRTREDFLSFMEEHPGIPVVELDSVEGTKGTSVLLTIHFKKAEMMLAFIRSHNDSASVTEVFNSLYKKLTPELFCRIFKVCVADNGTEFSNPSAIENDQDDVPRTRLFYCHPSAPYEKGSAERNHEFIRQVIPKGTNMSPYTQEDISYMMDNINSYARESLGGKTPYDMFSFLYGEEALTRLNCHRIPLKDINLTPSLLKRRKQNQ